MKNLGKNVFFTLLALYLAAYIIFFIISVLQFPTGDLLSIYFWHWVFLNSLIKLYVHAIPIGCSAILIAVSFLFAPKTEGGYDSIPFSSIINSTVLVILVLLCGYEISKEVFLPKIQSEITGMLYKTEIADNAMEKAKKYFTAGKLSLAEEMTILYLGIDPENREITQLMEDIRIKQNAQQTETALAKDPKREKEHQSENLSVSMYIEKAEYYFRLRDYYSAHYFANQALTIDPDRVDVKNLSALSWKKIEELEQNAKTREEARYYQRKRDGYTALQEKRYIDAYYIFEQLNEERPVDDPDIKKYFKESEKMVAQSAFFIEEAEKVRILPGIPDVLFLNRTQETAPAQFIYFNRYVASRTGYFATDIEILQLAPDNTIEFQLHAPYGKILDTTQGAMLLLKGISRTNMNETVSPEYYIKTSSSSNLPDSIIPIHIDKEAIAVCNIHEDFIQHASIPVLLNFRNDYHAFGYSEYTINMEIVNRLRDPFMYLILMFFSMCLGWVSRVTDKGKKLYMFLVLPVIPFLYILAVQSYKTAGSIVYMFFLLQLGFGVTIALVVLFSTILLFLSLFTLALQTSRS